VIAVPLAVFCGWVAATLLVRAYKLHRDKDVEAKGLPTQQARPSTSVTVNKFIRQDGNR
jgi:hypothetical protein